MEGKIRNLENGESHVIFSIYIYIYILYIYSQPYTF